MTQLGALLIQLLWFIAGGNFYMYVFINGVMTVIPIIIILILYIKLFKSVSAKKK